MHLALRPLALALSVLTLAAHAPVPAPSPAPEPPLPVPLPPCAAAVRSALDFWSGEWTVADAASRKRAGLDRVERVDGGVAMIEHWNGVEGDEGVSLFYFDPAACTWRQVWITERPDLPGGLKHKELVAVLPAGGVRFQGVYPGRRVPAIMDRTTLLPQRDGTVRQRIEISLDGGDTWQASFEAIYTRR